MQMRRTADRLLGDNYHWSVLGAGANQMRVAAMAAAMGGNVRVGLEDSLWVGPGQLAQSNAEQVTQARKILEGLGLEVATPDEAREILSLKGGDKVRILSRCNGAFCQRQIALVRQFRCLYPKFRWTACRKSATEIFTIEGVRNSSRACTIFIARSPSDLPMGARRDIMERTRQHQYRHSAGRACWRWPASCRA